MIGQRIRELRKQHKMTQEQVAAFLNLAKSTISQYENSINEPDIETIVKLADRFNVTVDYLLGRDFYVSPVNAPSPNTMLMERLTEDEAEYLKESLDMYRKWKSKRKNAEQETTAGETPPGL
jgi:transcriptional regulator with XRE-family HTH domain